MPIMKVVINGTTHIVESPDVRTAKSWAKQQVTIEVSDANAVDLRNLKPEQEIPVLGQEEAIVEDVSGATILDSKPAAKSKFFGLGG